MAESIILNSINNVLGMLQSFAPAETNAVTFLLTFLLIFSISFSSVLLIPAFKDTNKRAIGTIIALAIAYFSSTNPIVTTSVEKVFPAVGLTIIGAAAFMLTISFVIPNQANNVIKYLLGPIIIGVVLLISWGAFTQWQTPLFANSPDGILLNGYLISYYDVWLFIFIVIIPLTAIFFLARDKDKETPFDVLMKVLKGK